VLQLLHILIAFLDEQVRVIYQLMNKNKVFRGLLFLLFGVIVATFISLFCLGKMNHGGETC